MEAIMKEDALEGLKKYFLKEPKPFVAKREFNWAKVKYVGWGLFIVVLAGILFWPAPKTEQTAFHEKAENGSLGQIKTENDPTQETVKQLQESEANLRQVHSSLDYLYRSDSSTGIGGGVRGGKDRNTAMILGRSGADGRTQLSSGTKIIIRLNGNTTISKASMPVIGLVARDVASESGIAIPTGSKVLGDASFDTDSEQTFITWRSIILADGRERPFSAQSGIEGNVHSDGMKNAVGQTLTRFVGAYAAGSMNTGAFGANQGGNVNGLRNAIAQTATDRANAMGEDMKKERKWIELENGTETIAVLNQAFAFRDAGATYGN